METGDGEGGQWQHSPMLCRTIVEESSEFGNGTVDGTKRNFQCSRDRGNHGRVYITDDGNGERCVRRKAGTVGFRFNEDGKETVVYAARTNIIEDKRGEKWKGRGCHPVTAKVKGYGRVRTHIVVKETLDVTEQDSRMACCSDEIMEMIDISSERRSDGRNDGNGENGRRRRRRRRRANGTDGDDEVRTRRRRRRCQISLLDFTMFDEQRQPRRIRNEVSAMPTCNGTYQEKFKKSIQATISCIVSLQQSWANAPFLRCSGGRRREQKFICVATCRIHRNLFGGGVRKSVLISLLIEEESTKLRTITVRREREFCDNDTGYEATEFAAQEVTNWICSCDIRRTGSGMDDSQCWHTVCLKEDVVLVQEILKMMDCGFVDDHNMYFGSPLEVTENGSNRNYVIHGLESSNSLVAVQLDSLTEDDLLRKGRSVAKKRSTWISIDPADRLIVSVIWKAMSSGEKVTRMICGMCRMETSKKCNHEVACERESVKLVDSASSEFYEEEGERSSEEERIPETRPDPSLDAPCDFATDEIHLHAGSDNGQGLGVQTGRATGIQQQSTESNHAAHTWKAINDSDSKCFLPTGPRRSFLFCNSERRKAKMLCDLIETTNESSGSLFFFDSDGVSCGGVLGTEQGGRKKFKERRKKSVLDIPRECTLITLNHGTVQILLTDWECTQCHYLNRYEGYSHGIFPTTAGIAYTAELMYYWISEACNSTRSFRSVYNSTTKLKSTPSYSRRYVMDRMSKMEGWNRGNRRVANDAVRRFIQLIDLDSHEVASQIYSCGTCEVEMDDTDFHQLGLNAEEHRGLKRLRSVVIDAKVVGLLKDTVQEGDKHDVLNGVTGLNTRLVSNRPTQNALRLFVRLVRSSISKCRNARAAGRMDMVSNCNVEDVNRCKQDGYFLEDNYMFVRLRDIGKLMKTNDSKKSSKLHEYIGIIRWFLDNTACLCMEPAKCILSARGGETVRRGATTVRCKELRSKMQNSKGRGEATYALQNLFVHCREEVSTASASDARNAAVSNNTSSSGNPANREETATNEPEQGEDSASSSEENEDSSDVSSTEWARLVFGEFYNIEYSLESVLEVILFSLTEPLSLGFLPYTGTRTVNSSSEPIETSSNVNNEPSGGEDTNNGATMASNGSNEDNPVHGRDGTDAMVAIESLLSNVIDTSVSGSTADRSGVERRLTNSDVEIRGAVKRLGTEAVTLHRTAISRMEDAAGCTHGGRRCDQWICPLCANGLSSLNPALAVQNAVLGRFVNITLRYGESNARFARRTARLVAFLFKRRVDSFEQYMNTLSKKLHPSCVQYWRMFGEIEKALANSATEPTTSSSTDNSLYVFPGRRRCRTGITFDKIDKQECTKHYFKRGSTIVPSFLTVQCACAHPKLMGFVLLNQCESISAALSSVVTHFPLPPRVIWYDNACNTYDSALIRIPWLLRWSRLVVDRFHYKGHNCSNTFNGDMRRELDLDRSVSAEVINSIINKGATHIAYLDGENVKPFMRVVFAYVNAAAAVRDKTGRDDLEDDDVEKYIAELYTCYCQSCTSEGTGVTDVGVPDGVALFSRYNEVVDIGHIGRS